MRHTESRSWSGSCPSLRQAGPCLVQQMLRSVPILPLRSSVPAPYAVRSQQRGDIFRYRSEEHTSELQSRLHLVCRLLLEKKKKNIKLSLSRLSTYPQRHY